jgi:hypothetical protein
LACRTDLAPFDHCRPSNDPLAVSRTFAYFGFDPQHLRADH